MYETNLDYSTLDESYFVSMADILLNSCILHVAKHLYRLVEIEFYLKSDHHNDPYVHSDSDQLLMHMFYFHKFKTGTYKAGTFKGLDICFGSEIDGVYFGILIRSIQRISTGEIIEGPCNVVNRILKEYECDSIMDFTLGDNLNIFENDHDFVLKVDDDLPIKEIFYGPRIGLSDKYPEYQNRLYRFTTNKDRIRKNKTSLTSIRKKN